MKRTFTFVLTLVLSISPLIAEEKSDAKSAMTVDKDKKSIRIACKMAPRKLPNLEEIYPIEVVASWAAPKGQKAHETIVTFDIKPSELHKALESFGLKPGKPAKGQDSAAEGPEVRVLIEFTNDAGATKKLPVEKVLVDRKTGKTMPTLKWRFTGSAMKKLDPTKEDQVYGADHSGTLIGIFPVTDETVIQSNLTMKEEPFIKMETNKELLPKEGTDVTLIIEAK